MAQTTPAHATLGVAGLATLAYTGCDAPSRPSEVAPAASDSDSAGGSLHSPCGELPCPVDEDGHMALDCLCDLIDCPTSFTASIEPDHFYVVSTRDCGDQVVVGYESEHFAKAFGYRGDELVSAFGYDHADGSACLWHATPDFPSSRDCNDECLLSYRGLLEAEPGSCIDGEELSEFLGMGGSFFVR